MQEVETMADETIPHSIAPERQEMIQRALKKAEQKIAEEAEFKRFIEEDLYEAMRDNPEKTEELLRAAATPRKKTGKNND